MTQKMLEVRDRGTCMPVCAIELSGDTMTESFFLEHAGYGFDHPSILVVDLENVKAETDPFKWDRMSRTMKQAHLYIRDNFEALNSGDVVDVEFILGESKRPKISEIVHKGR